MHDILRRFMLLPVFEAEGAGTGDGGDGSAPGSGDGGWKAPEGIPEEFMGADADETLGKLLGGYQDVNTRFNGMRDKLSKMPAAPKTPDEYAFDPGESLSPFFGDLSEDKMFSAAREAAHRHGMSQEQFAGFISDTFGPMAEAGLLAEPFNPKTELSTYQSATGLDAKGVEKSLQQNETFANGLIEQLDLPKDLSDAAKGMFMGLTDTAAGNAILQALSARMSDSGFGLEGHGGGDGQLTDADLQKLDSDPRIDPQNRDHKDPNKRFDPDLRKRYDDAYRRLNR